MNAVKMSDTEYHLFIRPDTNTEGHTQWFYFKVANMIKGTKYTFKIVNFNKKHSAFRKGMKPTVFSSKRYTATKEGWDSTEVREVDYFLSPFNKTMNSVTTNKYKEFYGSDEGAESKPEIGDGNLNVKAKKLYCLAFTYE